MLSSMALYGMGQGPQGDQSQSQGGDESADDDQSSHPESTTDVAVRASAASARQCEQCGQSYQQVDKYLLPKQVPLKWARMRQTETGREPDGWECWGCEARGMSSNRSQ